MNNNYYNVELHIINNIKFGQSKIQYEAFKKDFDDFFDNNDTVIEDSIRVGQLNPNHIIYNFQVIDDDDDANIYIFDTIQDLSTYYPLLEFNIEISDPSYNLVHTGIIVNGKIEEEGIDIENISTEELSTEELSDVD